MVSLQELEKEVKDIQERNQRVELDKSWETSVTRKLVLSVATYIVIVSFMIVSKIPEPWTNATVPAIAFILSTLYLPFFKEFWKNHIHKG